MADGIPVFDTTIQKSNEWVSEVAAELRTSDRNFAYRVLRGVLHALRDRLTVDEAVRLGAELPMLLRGAYFEGWRPGNTTTDDHPAFLDHIQTALSDQSGIPDPERWARAVFLVLARRVDIGEMQEVDTILPRDVASLWPQGQAG